MIRLTSKISENDQERTESLNYIESISNDKKSFLDLIDPYKKSRNSGKATHDPVTNEITEDVV